MKAIVYQGHEEMRVDSVADPGLHDATDILLEGEKSDRKSDAQGKRVDLGGRRTIK